MIDGNGSEEEESVSFTIPIPPATPPRNFRTPLSTPTSISANNSSPGINNDNNVNISSLVDQYALINNSGICNSCNDASALKTSLTCLMCSHKFHAVCTNVDGDKSGNEVICARTFYSSFMKASGGVYSQRPGNFVFICDFCMTSFEHKKTAKSEDKLDKMGSRVDNLSQNVDEIKSMLLDLSSRTNSVHAQSDQSESSITSMGINQNATTENYKNALLKNSKTRSVLIIENNNATDKSIDNIIIENGIHVDKTVNKESGNSVFVCPTQEDRDNLNKKISEAYPELKTRQPPELLPTISVANLSTNYQVNQLKEVIFKEHRDIKFISEQGEKFEVISVRPQKKDNSKFHATIRVGNNIRKIIKNLGDRLYIGSNSNPVYDSFHIKRCNKCQKFNHYHADCKASESTCGYCSGKHESKSCPEKTDFNFSPKCSNCSVGSSSNCESHSAFDLNCPAYKAEQEKRRKMIHFYNQKN